MFCTYATPRYGGKLFPSNVLLSRTFNILKGIILYWRRIISDLKVDNDFREIHFGEAETKHVHNSFYQRLPMEQAVLRDFITFVCNQSDLNIYGEIFI